MNGNPRPCITAMEPDQFADFLQTQRICTGCQTFKKTKDFSITTERGKKVVRSRCKECLKAYYKTVSARRVKVGAVDQPKFSRPIVQAKRTAVRKKLKVTFSVIGSVVFRNIEGCRPKSVRVMESEQAAEAEAKRLGEFFNGGQP